MKWGNCNMQASSNWWLWKFHMLRVPLWSLVPWKEEAMDYLLPLIETFCLRIFDCFNNFFLSSMTYDYTANNRKLGAFEDSRQKFMFLSFWSLFCQTSNSTCQSVNEGNKKARKIARPIKVHRMHPTAFMVVKPLTSFAFQH